MTVIFLFPFILFAQDSATCQRCLKAHYDEVTGKTSVYTSDLVLSSDGGKTGMAIVMMKGEGRAIIISIRAANPGLGCIDDKNIIYFLFTDSTRLEMISNSQYNCKGESVIYFGEYFNENDEALEALKTKTIKIIRITGTGSYVQRSLTIEQANTFRMQIQCLYKKIEKKPSAPINFSPKGF